MNDPSYFMQISHVPLLLIKLLCGKLWCRCAMGEVGEGALCFGTTVPRNNLAIVNRVQIIAAPWVYNQRS